jgi:hypothetical protein
MFTVHDTIGPDQELVAAELLREYLAWATSLESFSNEAPTFRDVETELMGIPEEYRPPRWRLHLGHSRRPGRGLRRDGSTLAHDGGNQAPLRSLRVS